MKHATLLTFLASSVFLCASSKVEAGGNIKILMYSLPAKGVALRDQSKGDDVEISVQVFEISSTEQNESQTVRQLTEVVPKDANDRPFITDGTVEYQIPDDLYRRLDDELHRRVENVALEFRFFSRTIGTEDFEIVQDVVGAVVPRQGTVELHVVVPSPWQRMRNCTHSCGTGGTRQMSGKDISAGDKAVVSASSAPMRIGAEIVGTLRQQTVVSIRRVEGPWLWTTGKVGESNVQGWVHRDDVTRIDQAFTLAPVESNLPKVVAKQP